MWHGCRQLTVLNKYENKYELKAAANESKSKPNVGKGIASPSLVPGAEGGERECLVSTVCTCGQFLEHQDISVTLTSVSQLFFPHVEDAYYQPCSE